jgi:hypothetical protein
MIHHDASAGLQGRGEHGLDIGQQDVAISRTRDGHHGLEALDAHGSQPGHLGSIVLGNGPDDPLPCGRAAIQTGHGQVHP